jgi:hypothetical protein
VNVKRKKNGESEEFNHPHKAHKEREQKYLTTKHQEASQKLRGDCKSD